MSGSYYIIFLKLYNLGLIKNISSQKLVEQYPNEVAQQHGKDCRYGNEKKTSCFN